MAAKLLHLARSLLLAMLLIAVQAAEGLAEPHEGIVGVWLTIDASDEEGRRQGGVYFRADGTGGFLAATYTSDFDSEYPDLLQFIEMLLDAANIPPEGIADITFEYSTHDEIVTIQVKTFMGIEASGEPEDWVYRFKRNMLRLTMARDQSHWILLERAE